MRSTQANTMEAIHDAATKASLAISYAVMGAAGVMLWVLVQLPVGARAKEMLVYAMAGCVGTFTLGWQMLRSRRPR